MNIYITDELKIYLKKKSHTSIVLENIMKRVCCASPLLPSVRVGKVTNIDNYHIKDIDGIRVYVHKGIKYAREVLKIDVRKFLFVYEIHVSDPATKCFCSGQL